MSNPVQRRVAFGAWCVVTTLIAAACGGGGGEDTASSVPIDGGLKGAPIVVGVVYVDSGSEQQTEFLEGAEATARYINNDLGGVDKRPIQLEICKLDGSPESSARCANELAAKNPVAVIAGQDIGTDASLPIYERAGIPYISYSARTNQMYVNPVAIALGGGVPGYGAVYGKFLVEQLGAEQIAMITPDVVPPAAIEQYFGTPVERLGGELQVIPYTASSPNLTAPFQVAAQSSPDALIVVLESDANCVQAIRTQQQLGLTMDTLQLHCNEDDVFETVGSAADGMYFTAAMDVGAGSDVSTDDLQTYLDFMDKYAPTAEPDDEARWGAMSLMTLHESLMALKGNLTASAVLRKMKAPQGGHVFLGNSYRCGQLEDYPSICVTELRFSQYSDGELQSVSEWMDAVELFA